MNLVRKRDESTVLTERPEKKTRFNDSESPFSPIQLHYSLIQELHNQRKLNIVNLPENQVSLFLESEIIETMLEEEAKCQRVNYQTTETHFKNYIQNNRKFVVSWMVDVFEEEGLSMLTLHYAVSFLDRLLQIYPKIEKENYQTFAMACTLIAGKTTRTFNISFSKKRRKC
jgi:hypothetical protein